MFLTITEFFGHFHPLIVHLPVGILLIGLLLQWLSKKEKYKNIQPAIAITLLCGSVSAFVSCITGYLLSISDDYDKTLVSWHMWMGIATALVSLMLYAKEKNPAFAINKPLLAVGLFILIIITGHLGGSLTHGSDYLTKPLKTVLNNDSTNTSIKPLQNVQEALAYNDIIKPILETKCYSCHGQNKQKGSLRMDDSARLMKGGKDGVIIKPGSAEQSEIIKRLLLPIDNDDHMPPKEKSQPSESQINLLYWWIANDASFNKKVKEISQDEKVKPFLLALQSSQTEKKEFSFLPSKNVEAADEKILQQLKDSGILVMPLIQNSNYLQASFINNTNINEKNLQLLLQLKKQLVYLKLSATNANDETISAIAQCTNLIKLFLDNTKITDKSMANIAKLDSLRYLNIVGTNVSAQGLQQLIHLANLKNIYLYKTAVTKNDWSNLLHAFPKTILDTGNYFVPTLATDTTEVKAKKEY